MSRLFELKKHLRTGNVYSRAELKQLSSSIDRQIVKLVAEGALERVGSGLYYYPKKNLFGKEPPSNKKLVKKYLKDGKFLITSYNQYNKLGFGTTQLYNNLVVYNHSKSGIVKLGNKTFKFRKKSNFPTAYTKEYLIVELVNNLEELAEDQPAILHRIHQSLPGFDLKALEANIGKYGTAKTRKLLSSVILNYGNFDRP